MIIRIDPALMEEMRQAFSGGIEDLDAVTANMNKIVESLQSGALVGVGGDALADGISRVLVKKIEEIRTKFEEMIVDLHTAETYLDDADETAGNNMGL